MIHAVLFSLANAYIPESEVLEIPVIQHASAEELAMRLELRAVLDNDVSAMEQGLALYELILDGMEEGDEIARTRIAAGILANQLEDLDRARMHLAQAQWHPVYGAEAEAILADLDR